MVAFFLIVMPARAAWADEPTKSDEERAIDIAQELISTIVDQEGYQDLYELQIDDSSNISLGEHIEIAAEIDGELRSTNLDLWPVFDNEKIIATLVETRDESTGSSYRFSTADSEKLDAFFREATQGTIVFDETTASLISPSGKEAHLDQLLDASSYISDVRRGERQKGELSSNHYSSQAKKGSIDFDKDQVFANEASWHTWVTLGVPRMRQMHNNTCWATCASCVGSYLTHMHISDTYITQHIHGGAHVGTYADTIRALSLFHYSGTDRHVEGVHLSRALHQDEVNKWILNGLPVIARLSIKDSEIGHQVVVSGYSSSNGHPLVQIMNPAYGRYETLIRNSDGVVTSPGDHYLWDRGSIVMVGWERPYGEHTWRYFHSDGRVVD